MNDMELTSVDVRAASESLFQNAPSRTLPEQVSQFEKFVRVTILFNLIVF